MILLAHFNHCVGQEYRPWDLFIGILRISNLTSSCVTGLKKNDASGDVDLKRKLR